MESSEDQRSFAWQPFTPRGVAAFAGAALGRLLLVQFLVALLTAVVVVWFVGNDWFPTIRTAIEQLPDQGSIRSARLDWRGDSPRLLAESRFLALAVDLRHGGEARSPAHLQVELGQTDVRVYSLFGCLQVPYPRGYVIALNVAELKPWWGAWAPALLALVALAVLAGLVVSWAVLATLYCLPAWLLGLYCDRELSLCGSWRLAGAALMPGALVMTALMGLYALAAMDVVHLVAAWALHILLGCGYLIFGVLTMPRLRMARSPKTSPFARIDPNPDKPSDKPASSEPSNPFSPKR